MAGTAAAAGQESEGAAGGGQRASIYNPPIGKFNKANAVREFQQGIGHLYPKVCSACGTCIHTDFFLQTHPGVDTFWSTRNGVA